MVALVQPWVSLHQQLGGMKEEEEEEGVEGRGGGEERRRVMEAEGERREASNGRYQKCAAVLMPV